MRTCTLLFVALTALVACGGDVADPTPVGEELGGHWVLMAGTVGGRPLPFVEGTRVTLEVRGTELSGSSGCNSYGTRPEWVNGRVRMDEVSTTLRGCEAAIAALETTYLDAFRQVQELARNGETLVLRGPDIELRYEALPEVESGPMVDVEWVLETLLVGDIAAPAMGERATLVLHADGTVEGSTGCRALNGTWLADGDQVVFPALDMTGPDCPMPLRDQDGHVVTVIGDGFIPTVEGDLLTLVDPGGAGLVYRAESAE